MGETLAELRSAVEAFASRFDARLLSAADASRLWADATAMRNMISTIETMAAARVTAPPRTTWPSAAGYR